MAFENPLKHLSKPQLYGVIGGSVLLAGVFEYQHHKSTGSWNPFTKTSSAAGDGTQIDPITGLAYSQDNVTDPVTGLTYLGEAQQYGSVQTAESSVGAYGQSSGYGTSSASGSGYPVQPASPGLDGSSTPAAGSVSSATYTSDAAWAQAATAGLAQIGYNETDVASALGAYLNGQQLTPAQANLVNAARSEFGKPPGNEPVILAPVTQPGNPGPGPVDKGGPPTVYGPPSVSGGHVVTAKPNDATVAWTGHNAVKYGTEITGPGKINGQRGTVTATEAVYSGLESGHNYAVTVTPYNAAGKAGASGRIDIVTPPVKK